ncbi:hypothetical protein MTR67_019253, partial [Solanum verrucosum]
HVPCSYYRRAKHVVCRGPYQIYYDGKNWNEHQRQTRTITQERRVLIVSLHIVPTIKELFKTHKCEWMAQSPGKFSDEMARELYASYVATVRYSISKRAKLLAQPPLQATLVQIFFVDISETTIRQFIYGPDHTLPINTAAYEYMMGMVQSGAFQRDTEKIASLLRWMTRHIAVEGECIEWVHNMTLPIRKAILSFTVKFFWTIVRTRLSPTQVDNVVTWDRAVMLAALRFMRGPSRPPPLFLFFVSYFICAGKLGDPQVNLPPLGADLADDVEQIQIQAVHKRLDAFGLRVLEWPAPTIDVTAFQIKLARLRADVDALLAPAKFIPEPAHEVEDDEVVMSALFGDTVPPPDLSQASGKRHSSFVHTSDDKEARRAKKRERQEIEAAQRHSLFDEELHLRRAREIEF